MSRRIPMELEQVLESERIPHRKVPESYQFETRCYWICPCGGTVPDAPDHCVWRKKRGMNGEYCTDAAICASRCPDRAMCAAYKKFKELLKHRHMHDENCSRKRRQDRSEKV